MTESRRAKMAFLSIHTMEGDPDDLLAPRPASFERFVNADYTVYQTA
jgi:hypothetical protein